METIPALLSHLPWGKGRKELSPHFSSCGRVGVATGGAGLGKQGEKFNPIVLSSLACPGDQHTSHSRKHLGFWQVNKVSVLGFSVSVFFYPP